MNLFPLKYYVILILVLAFHIKLEGQLEVYLDEIPDIGNMEIFQNKLYFNYGGGQFIGVSDLTDEKASFSVLTTLAHSTPSFSIVDSFLYYSAFDQGAIYRINIENKELNSEKIIEGLIRPSLTVVVNNNLFTYVTRDSLDLSPSNKRILQFDLANIEKEPKVVVDSILLTDMDRYRDNLIFSIPRCIYIYDGKDTKLIENVPGPVNGVAIRNDELYATETAFTQTSNGSVNKLNLLDIESGFVNITKDALSPLLLAADDEYLYIYEEYIFRMISRIRLEKPSSISNTNLNKEIEVFPNPASDFVQVVGEDDGRYSVYSINGSKILSGILEVDEKINISSLPSGNYILRLENGGITLFQKIDK